MGGWYEDARGIAFKQGPVLHDLLRGYLRRNGSQFLLLSETPFTTRMLTTACLVAIYITLLLSLVILNPLVQIGSTLELIRGVCQWLVIFLMSSVPLYMVVRPGTGIPSLHFFLNVQLVAASVALAVMCPIIITGLLLSPNLNSDMHEVAAGRGQQTAIYDTYCRSLEYRRDTILLEQRLNSISGEFDQPYMNGSIFDTRADEARRQKAMTRFVWQEAERENQLPEAARKQVQAMRLELGTRLLNGVQFPTRLFADYPYFIYSFLVAQFAVPITSVLSYIIIWKVFVSRQRYRRWKFVNGMRVFLGITVSMLCTLWMIGAITNRPLHTKYSMSEMRQMLHEEAQSYAWCRLDPKGLW
jgi:hypothetical protein